MLRLQIHTGADRSRPFRTLESVQVTRFDIHSAYQHRLTPAHHDDSKWEDEFQDSVYQFAKAICDIAGYRSVVDVGCGSGFKLLNYLNDLDTVGTEIGPALHYLKNRYPNRTWRESDLTASHATQCDLVVCADVVEHIPDPDDLLGYLGSIDRKTIVMSPPGRDCLVDRLRGAHTDAGPRSTSANQPPHPLTARQEWLPRRAIACERLLRAVLP